MPTLTTNQQHWQSIIEDWQQSGLTQADYCRQHQIKPQRFYAWKHQLKAKQNPINQHKPGTFLPVLLEHPEPKKEPTLKVICQGAEIEITHTTDADLFKKAVHWLGGLS